MVKSINKAIRRIPIWFVYLILSLPGIWWFYLAATNQFGAEPLKHLIMEYGEMALKLLVVVLIITPLQRLFKISAIRLRRSIGVMSFVYAAAHMVTWLVLDQGLDPRSIWTELTKRPFITIGMIAFLVMLPLALTSNDYSVRKLRAKWGRLHRLVYPLALLAVLHFTLVVKGWPVEPSIYLLIIATLLGMRVYWRRQRLGRAKAMAAPQDGRAS